MNNKQWREGGCHCGAVRFRLQHDLGEVIACNCSICTKKGFIHVIVPKQDFELRQGEADLSTYTFNTHIAKHYFCKHCGICSFYIPRSHPDGYSVNLRCIDEVAIDEVSLKPFDGKRWEDNIDSIGSPSS